MIALAVQDDAAHREAVRLVNGADGLQEAERLAGTDDLAVEVLGRNPDVGAEAVGLTGEEVDRLGADHHHARDRRDIRDLRVNRGGSDFQVRADAAASGQRVKVCGEGRRRGVEIHAHAILARGQADRLGVRRVPDHVGLRGWDYRLGRDAGDIRPYLGRIHCGSVRAVITAAEDDPVADLGGCDSPGLGLPGCRGTGWGRLPGQVDVHDHLLGPGDCVLGRRVRHLGRERHEGAASLQISRGIGIRQLGNDQGANGLLVDATARCRRHKGEGPAFGRRLRVLRRDRAGPDHVVNSLGQRRGVDLDDHRNIRPE